MIFNFTYCVHFFSGGVQRVPSTASAALNCTIYGSLRLNSLAGKPANPAAPHKFLGLAVLIETSALLRRWKFPNKEPLLHSFKLTKLLYSCSFRSL